MKERTTVFAWLACVSCLPVLAGCTAREEVSYVYRDAVAELPQQQREQLQKLLTRFYGTPSDPRLMRPDDEAEVEQDAESGQETQIPLVDVIDRQRLRHGQRVYVQNCAPCHGVTGDGNGPAAQYLNPKPRDYRLGKFKFTSTPRSAKPRRSDLLRTIRYGAKGTSMPAFRWLPEEDLQPLVDYVIALSQRGELEKLLLDEVEYEMEEEDDFDMEIVVEYSDLIAESWAEAGQQVVLPVSRQPPYSDESILAGRKAFLTHGCAKCHGDDGRGHSEANVGQDDWGNTVFAADLTAGMLHGGRRPLDVYRRIYSGINGAPMPAFGDALAEEPDTLWDLVHYVMSIVDNRQVDGIEDVKPEPPAVTPGPEETTTVSNNS